MRRRYRRHNLCLLCAWCEQVVGVPGVPTTVHSTPVKLVLSPVHSSRMPINMYDAGPGSKETAFLTIRNNVEQTSLYQHQCSVYILIHVLQKMDGSRYFSRSLPSADHLVAKATMTKHLAPWISLGISHIIFSPRSHLSHNVVCRKTLVNRFKKLAFEMIAGNPISREVPAILRSWPSC